MSLQTKPPPLSQDGQESVVIHGAKAQWVFNHWKAVTRSLQILVSGCRAAISDVSFSCVLPGVTRGTSSVVRSFVPPKLPRQNELIFEHAFKLISPFLALSPPTGIFDYT